jgi:copper oxidase (laccase) domain-containing protein
VHAGWRGTRARILAKLLRALAETGRIRPEKTWVAFGPCLRPQTLAIGPEVATQLDTRFLSEKAGRIHFDMPADNRAQALESGIAPGHIRDLGGDTLTEPERYFSYRRDGAASGRLAAFICLR